jgi:putative sigma-54 modulation protein
LAQLKLRCGIKESKSVAHFLARLGADPSKPQHCGNMNRQNNHELIVSGIHLELTPSLKTFVREKADRLFRHEEHIVRLRVELEYDPKEEVDVRFKAKGHILINGPAMNAVVESDECHKAVSLLTDKLDRMLRRRARLFKVKRKQPRVVNYDDLELPRAV